MIPDSMDNLIIRFVNVQHSFDGKELVVKDMSLDVRRGEFLTLLGPSGSGKTTCLMMLAGFINPTEGVIELDGVPIADIPPHKRNIGVVFQDYALFPNMDVADNIGYPLRVRGMKAGTIRERVEKALAMIGLEHLASRPPAQLSGGQKQRVALARALVFEPTVVLMDEPLGALDRQLREKMQIEIKEMHDQLGVTVVYVTHDQNEALTMSNRVAVFHDGRVVQLGPPGEIYNSPANNFVARFVGESNFYPGFVQEQEGAYYRVRLDAGIEVTARSMEARAAGTRVNVYIRPEKISLSDDVRKKNSVSLKVKRVINVGDHLRVQANTDGELTFVVKVSPLDLKTKVQVGDIIVGSWDSDDCLALDAV